jgi:hypothetical protein
MESKATLHGGGRLRFMTTIRLDENLLSEAKRRAARRGTTITTIIEEALRESFSRRDEPRERPTVKLPTWGHGGVHPGVDLDSNAALLDLIGSEERQDDPS